MTAARRSSEGSATSRSTARGPVSLPPPALARDVSRRLRAWFRRYGRDLPWRKTRDPYRILVSELMLQQTQVSRVIDYYHRFLDRFPTMHRLAESPPAHVLEAWAGLGYYARARNLHALAIAVTRERDGMLPADPALLRTLPGVGAYTAGAVASFAFEVRAGLVDTNVARVLARVFAPRLDPKRPRDLSQLWRIAESVLPARGATAWTHNQALMELGALVCTARVRHCVRCPLRTRCRTRLTEIERAARGVPGADRGTTSPSGGLGTDGTPGRESRNAGKPGEVPIPDKPGQPCQPGKPARAAQPRRGRQSGGLRQAVDAPSPKRRAG